MKSKTLIVIVLLLLSIGGVVFLSQKKNTNQALQLKTQPDVQPAVLENGKIQPETFDYSHQQDLVISAYAKDKDYTISIPDIGLTQTIAEGETATVDLIGIGVGTTSFSCGETCFGTITVQPDVDSDR